MPDKKVLSKHQLTAGGGTINLDAADHVDLYVLYTSGSVTLTSPYTIQTTGTDQEGHFYKFHYKADLDFDSNAFTIMGVTMPEDIDGNEGIIEAYYDGSAWSVSFAPTFGDTAWITGTMMAAATIATGNYTALSVDRAALAATVVDAGKIDTSAVTNAKIAALAVTVDKLENPANEFQVVMPVSFETGEQCDNTITMPYDGTLTSVRYDVTKALAATDAGSITPLVNGGGTTPSAISLTASKALNASTITSITAGNTFTVGQIIKMTTAKTTAGGKVILTLTFTRT